MTKAAELAKMGEVLTNSQIGGRRNIIINGAMQVAQRSTSETGLGAATGYFTLDRFKTFFNTAGRLTMTQTADGPSGFANCLKLDCTTADTSIAATENFILSHAIEAQDLQQLKKGTSDAEKFTLSFYVKGNASATYSVEIYDGDNDRQIGQTFSVTTDWTRVILTFPADTTGALADDNGIGFYVNWWLHSGTNYNSGTFSTSWTAQTTNQRAGNTTSFFDSTDRTFFLTGVQLEVGEQATPFEHRSFGEELALCQRYFHSTTFANGKAASAGGLVNSSTIGVISGMAHPVIMRASPTASINDVTHMGVRQRAAVTTCTNVTISTSQRACTMELTVSSGLTVGDGCFARSVNNSCTLSFDAEL
tara:strand:+ start:88 stop:1176 length:1089 start_codon:yes stop_codon:yes gene_type:complete